MNKNVSSHVTYKQNERENTVQINVVQKVENNKYNITTFITFFISGNPVICVSPFRKLVGAIYLEMAHSNHFFLKPYFFNFYLCDEWW